MKSPRHSSYPMPAEDGKELARELSEFGYRETDDPDEAAHAADGRTAAVGTKRISRPAQTQ
jgi:hypothetical protein